MLAYSLKFLAMKVNKLTALLAPAVEAGSAMMRTLAHIFKASRSGRVKRILIEYTFVHKPLKMPVYRGLAYGLSVFLKVIAHIRSADMLAFGGLEILYEDFSLFGLVL